MVLENVEVKPSGDCLNEIKTESAFIVISVYKMYVIHIQLQTDAITHLSASCWTLTWNCNRHIHKPKKTIITITVGQSITFF